MKLLSTLSAFIIHFSIIHAATIPPSTSASSYIAELKDVKLDNAEPHKRVNPLELYSGASFSGDTLTFIIRNIEETARSEFNKLPIFDTNKIWETCSTEAANYLHDYQHGPLGLDYFTHSLSGSIQFFRQLHDSRLGYVWDTLPKSIMHDMALAALHSVADIYGAKDISYVQWDVVTTTGILIYTFGLYGRKK